MIYEKFEPKNYAKARMKNARPSAALVREAPKPQRPLLMKVRTTFFRGLRTAPKIGAPLLLWGALVNDTLPPLSCSLAPKFKNRHPLFHRYNS